MGTLTIIFSTSRGEIRSGAPTSGRVDRGRSIIDNSRVTTRSTTFNPGVRPDNTATDNIAPVYTVRDVAVRSSRSTIDRSNADATIVDTGRGGVRDSPRVYTSRIGYRIYQSEGKFTYIDNAVSPLIVEDLPEGTYEVSYQVVCNGEASSPITTLSKTT